MILEVTFFGRLKIVINMSRCLQTKSYPIEEVWLPANVKLEQIKEEPDSEEEKFIANVS